MRGSAQAQTNKVAVGGSETYNSGVNECAPATLVLEQSKDEGDSSGTEENQDKLVFELLENKLPYGSRRLFGNCCTEKRLAFKPCAGAGTGTFAAEKEDYRLTILAMLFPLGSNLRICQTSGSLHSKG